MCTEEGGSDSICAAGAAAVTLLQAVWVSYIRAPRIEVREELLDQCSVAMDADVHNFIYIPQIGLSSCKTETA